LHHQRGTKDPQAGQRPPFWADIVGLVLLTGQTISAGSNAGKATSSNPTGAM